MPMCATIRLAAYSNLAIVCTKLLMPGAALEILEREPGILLLFTDLGLPGEIDGRTWQSEPG